MSAPTESLPPVPRLPPELLYHVIDQLVDTGNRPQPLAFAPSSDTTRTLRSLTLVSRTVYTVASQYLYSRCVFLHTLSNYALFLRTLGSHLPSLSHLLEPDWAVRNERFFSDTSVSKQIVSAFISPTRTKNDKRSITMGPLLKLPRVIELCHKLGGTLRRLALDFSPVRLPRHDSQSQDAHNEQNSVFTGMPRLEELILSFHVLIYFRFPPPNLKRLAVTEDGFDNVIQFIKSISSLECLVFLRPLTLNSAEVDALFATYHGEKLDVVLVDVNSNHRTPFNTRSWRPEDRVIIWEADVPKSFYGDEEDIDLCTSYIWTHGVNGTLWTNDWRRMASWGDIQKRLAGPVHTIVGEAAA